MYRQPTPNNPVSAILPVTCAPLIYVSCAQQDPMGFRGVPTTSTEPESEKRSLLHPFGKTESHEAVNDGSLERSRNITGGSGSSGDSPTGSHALAAANHGEKGAAQQDHGLAEVKDLGWQEHVSNVPTPLVGGLPNEELWVLVRRFNKVRNPLWFDSRYLEGLAYSFTQQMYHVKATTAYLPGGLDLNIADEEEFSPDKLRANIERLYMTVVSRICRTRCYLTNQSRSLASWASANTLPGYVPGESHDVQHHSARFAVSQSSDIGNATNNGLGLLYRVVLQPHNSAVLNNYNHTHRLPTRASTPVSASPSCLGRL